MKQKLLYSSLLLLLGIGAKAQSGFVGIGTNTPKARLDIVSDTSGLLIPRYATLALVNTSVLPIMSSSVHNGLVLYVAEAANRGFWFYNGTAFEKVGKSESFFKVSSSDTNQIIYSDNSKYGKNFLVNTDSVNYDGSGNEYTKMMLIPSKYAVRLGTVVSANWDIDSIGNYSFASGTDTKASGSISTALGYTTTASGFISTALGEYTTASGSRSTAMGSRSTASGSSSTAMGYNTTASGENSIAMGRNTIASSDNSTAMGFLSTASGLISRAFGYKATASGDHATAMGFSTTASGFISTALGYNTIASGDHSTTLGYYTTASGNHSTANGINTLAPSYGELATGSYNDTLSTVDAIAFAGDSNRVFTVGNGTASARNTAFVVQQNGNVGVGDRKPSSLLDVNGSLSLPFRAITASYATTINDYTIRFSGSTTSQTVTLPVASTCPGRVYRIVNGGSVSLNVSSFLNLSGTAITSLSAASSLLVQSDGSDWYQIQ